MVLTTPLTKNTLEKLINRTFLNFGNITTSQLLDSLKAFGFFYATSSGISIGLEDLKNPEAKDKIKTNSNNYITETNKNWLKGLISDTERFQAFLNHWTSASEIIKQEIITYYKKYDPANSLYIMAFSGARGNISQVKQIVGARGLMSDQSGNVIAFPIESNFREGLSSVDYLISAYGARKGVVDTALKTAVAGYLTRRLIFLAQDIIIRQIDCKSEESITVDISKNINCENLIGRYSVLALENLNKTFTLLPKLTNCFLNKKDCNLLNNKKNKNIFLKIKSPLTCKNESSLCQKCYGWDLSKFVIISLGEAVGVVAAQSIGEPGTQLTLRTFHTGGVFNGDTKTNTFNSPFSGKIITFENLNGFYNRTIFGENIIKLIKNLKIELFHWKEGSKSFFIPKNLEFFIKNRNFIKKGENLGNLNSSKVLNNYGIKKLTPVYSSINCEILEEKLSYKPISPNIGLILNNSRISGALGKIYPFHAKANYRKFLNFKINKSIAFLNILIAPCSGLLVKNKMNLFLYTKTEKFCFNLQTCHKILNFYFFKKANVNLSNNLIIFPENYQFVDKGTVCARIETFPNKSEKLFQSFSKSEYTKGIKLLFCIRSEDVFNIYLDQTSNLEFNLKIGDIITFNKNLTSTLKIPIKGKLIKKDGFLYSFQLLKSFIFPKGSLFYKNKKKYFFEGELLSHSVIYKQQANDIVQGLPKINQLIEAKTLCEPYPLLSSSGLVFNTNCKNLIIKKKKNFIFNPNINYVNFYFEDKDQLNKKKVIFQTENSFLNSNTYFKQEKLQKNDLKTLENLKKNTQKNIKLFNVRFRLKNNFSFKKETNFSIYNVNSDYSKRFKFFEFLSLGQGVENYTINPHLLLFSFFTYFQNKKKSKLESCLLAFQKLQLLIINSIQTVYFNQGVKISNKHIELISRQLTAKIFILDYSPQKFLQKDFTYISIYKNYNKSLAELIEQFERKILFFYMNSKPSQLTNLKKSLEEIKKLEENLENFKILPAYLGCSKNSILKNSGFLAAAGFQDTKRVLIKAALNGSKDWLKGLQESIIAGHLIPAGSAYLDKKNYLDGFCSYLTNN